ncbi:hypothetical protein [Agromyces bauzanensis]
MSVLTGAGAVPYLVPTVGMVAVAATGESVWWASARGTLSEAASTGATVREVMPTAPAEGATILRRVTVDEAALIVWEMPDASAVLARHALTDGSVIGAVPVDHDRAVDARLLRAGGAAMLDTVLIPADPASSPVDTSAQAVVALGDVFYGSRGSRNVLIEADGTLIPAGESTVVPVGVSAGGYLVTVTNGQLAVFGHPDSAGRRDK